MIKQPRFTLLLRLLGLFCLSGIALTRTAFAQKTEITGKAPGQQGKRIILLGQADPISGLTRIMAEDTVSKKGGFHLETEIDRPQFLTLYCNYARGTWMASPGKYTIRFPKLGDRQVRSINGNTRVDLAITDAPKDDLNRALGVFTGRYATLIDTNVRVMGSRRAKYAIMAFEDSINRQFANADNYLGDYLKYRLAELKVGSGWKNTDLYKNYLADGPLPFGNVGFLSFIETFYADYFETYIRRFGPEALMGAVNGDGTWSELSALLARDDFLARKDLRRLIAAVSIRDAFGTPRFKPERLINLLEQMAADEHSGRKRWYKNLVTELRRGRVPFEASNFEVLNSTGDTIHLPPEQYTLIHFTASWCTACKKSALQIEEYASRYKTIQMVSLVTDDSKEGFESVVRNAAAGTKVFWAPDGFSARRSYRVPSLPYVVLINSEGKLINTPHKTGDPLKKKLFEINKRLKQTKSDDEPFTIGQGPKH